MAITNPYSNSDAPYQQQNNNNNNNNNNNIPSASFYTTFTHPSFYIFVSAVVGLVTGSTLIHLASKTQWGTQPVALSLHVALQCFLIISSGIVGFIRHRASPGESFKYHGLNQYNAKAIELFRPNASRAKLSFVYSIITLLATFICCILVTRLLAVGTDGNYAPSGSATSKQWWACMISLILLPFVYLVQIRTLSRDVQRKYERIAATKLTHENRPLAAQF
eukprot:UN02872